MSLTNCKECKKEVSTEARTCPYCGIANPGVMDSNRRVGAVVLALLIFLGIYIFTRHEKVVYQYSENAGISETTQSFSIQPPRLMEAPAKKTSIPPQQISVQKTPHPSVNQDQAKQGAPGLDKTKNVPSSDTPQAMVLRLLEYALKEGGLGHESEIQQTKHKIESSPGPEKGNKKAAQALNAKALASLKKGDFNNAVKMFEDAYKLDKSDTEIVNNLGFSYLKQGNLDSARQSITTALTLSPGRAAAWENLGEVFGLKGDLSKAVACFANAYRFSKDRSKMHQNMKKLNENEDVKNLKQARAKAIKWAEQSYLEVSKNTESKKESVKQGLKYVSK